MLDRLLDFTDNDLWDLIAGRREPQDQDVLPVLLQLRAA
jgi:succinate dehydrogenase flavin-adding protein (antitoxin of CptAB toxin-antitoxin module)